LRKCRSLPPAKTFGTAADRSEKRRGGFSAGTGLPFRPAGAAFRGGSINNLTVKINSAVAGGVANFFCADQ
jgi:hypothetical protein